MTVRSNLEGGAADESSRQGGLHRGAARMGDDAEGERHVAFPEFAGGAPVLLDRVGRRQHDHEGPVLAGRLVAQAREADGLGAAAHVEQEVAVLPAPAARVAHSGLATALARDVEGAGGRLEVAQVRLGGLRLVTVFVVLFIVNVLVWQMAFRAPDGKLHVTLLESF